MICFWIIIPLIRFILIIIVNCREDSLQESCCRLSGRYPLPVNSMHDVRPSGLVRDVCETSKGALRVTTHSRCVYLPVLI